MKTLPLALFFLFSTSLAFGFTDSLTIYFIPGTGADARQFKNLSLPADFKVKHIAYYTPKKETSMQEYAKSLSAQIDTSSKFALIGVSLGGMLALEMNEYVKPEKTILISSAKTNSELPGSYRFQRHFPLYKLIGPKLAKAGSQIVQPIFEPDRKKEKEIFKSMLKRKDPLFLDRAIAMTMQWERTSSSFQNVYHIHGEKDHTIPVRNVTYDYLIPKGSHLMTLTRAEEISAVLNEIFTAAR